MRYVARVENNAPALLFQAVIVPHRSLSLRALRGLLVFICLMCGTSAAVFVWLGAWPVGGFTGLELLLAAFLFRLNAHAAKGVEMVLLTSAGLSITRTEPSGVRRQRVLPAAWLNVVVEERPGTVPGLVLVARDVRVEIGRALGEAEKRDLASALAAALYDLRNPRFDNPQLRE
jgi:uncharacterized membrane protein